MKTKESTTPAAAATEPTKPIRLWLVDDNDWLRNKFAELLGVNEGIECTRSFGSATAALSALASKAGPDVLLLDIQMGQECGLDAVRPIRSLSHSTRVLMLTTFYDSDAKARALNDGASGLLLKHYPLERILESIRQASSLPEPLVRRRRACDQAGAAGLSDSLPEKPRFKLWLDRIRGIWN